MKKHTKGLISEQDISTLLQRYTATTILALLQEVAQCEGVKIDWNALMKNTSTGISNPREYQMLWRHLAYRHALLGTLPDRTRPMDDDSDLEYELEAFPSVTSDAATEAAACVRVLIASGLPSDSSHPNNTTVEAPLTINIPNGQSFNGTSESSQPAAVQGMNITVPVSVQKQPLPAEGFDAMGSAGSIPARRKRKPWSEEEDSELIAAVKKFGEGNWANILRSEFKGDRTASQLSQRWAIIRKRCKGNLIADASSSQLSEAQRAARHAMNLALDPPAKNTTTTSHGGTTLNNTSINPVPPTSTAETLPAQHQSQQHPVVTKSPLGPLSSATKPQVTLNKTSTISSLSSDPLRAAAVAAGARIATQSDAVSLLKAAQAKNAVHIMPTGGSSKKSPIPGVVSTHLEGHPNVHFISTGLAAAPLSSRTTIASCSLGPGLVKVPSPRTQHKPFTFTPSTKVSTEQSSAEMPLKRDGKAAVGIGASGSEDLATEEAQEEGACVVGSGPIKQVLEDKVTLPYQESQVAPTESPKTPKTMTGSDQVDAIDNQAESKQNANDSMIMGSLDKEGKKQYAFQGEEKQNINGDKVLCSPVKEGEKDQADGKQLANANKIVVENPSTLKAEGEKISNDPTISDSPVKEGENQSAVQAEGRQMENDSNVFCSSVKEVESKSPVHVNGDAQSIHCKQADIQSTITDEHDKRPVSVSIELGNRMLDKEA